MPPRVGGERATRRVSHPQVAQVVDAVDHSLARVGILARLYYALWQWRAEARLIRDWRA